MKLYIKQWDKCLKLLDITNKILKISMRNVKYSMFSSDRIRYTVNINKKHA